MSTDTTPAQVEADRWDSMTFDELLAQRSVLTNRYDFAVSRRKEELAAAMLSGLEKLDKLIQSKT